MRERIKMFHGVLSLLASLFGFTANAECPNPNLMETSLDCPWADVTRNLEGVTDLEIIRNTIDQKIPGFLSQVEKDGKSKGLLNLWGLSRNVDESNLATGLKTIPENLLQFFVSLWNVPYNSDYTVGHAGLNHTYGYLFSIQKTPYGYKRSRYVQGELEMGFGLPDGLFSGQSKQGTLLSNLSYFIGSIAFRDNQLSKDDLSEAITTGQIETIPELMGYDFSSLSIKRLVEVASNAQFVLELRTDIVQFPKNNTRGQDTALLIYSIDFHTPEQAARPRLITAFPVQPSFAAGLFDPTALGESVPLKLKYNAALPVTIPGELMVGKRFILNESKNRN